MLVRFESSETGEVLMFAEIAALLLHAIGKETTARGVFTQAEMLPGAARLRQAIADGLKPPGPPEEASDEDERKPPPVAIGPRAWPLLDMLERTARGGGDAYVIWEAAQDF